MNLFAYCNNNPVMNVDPSGHWSWKNILKGVATVVSTAVFVAAIVASAGAVGALAGLGAATIGLTATAVSTATTVATVATYVVAAGVAATGVSDAVESFSDGTNPIRDYVMGGNQDLYTNVSGAFNALGTAAVVAGAVAPRVFQSVAKTHGVAKSSNNSIVGYQYNLFDAKGNWNFRIDATTHGSPKFHHNPHYHVGNRGGAGRAIYSLWENLKKWFGF